MCGGRFDLILEMVHRIASLKNLTPFHKGSPYEEKEREPLFNVLHDRKQEKKLQPLEGEDVMGRSTIDCLRSMCDLFQFLLRSVT